MKKALWLLMCAALLAALCACGSFSASIPPAAPMIDPHEGMVEVSAGGGNTMWVEKYDALAVNAFADCTLGADAALTSPDGTRMRPARGIDVSEHQGEIDWAAVAADGVEFAMIRAGYRGCSEGGLYEDARFHSNMIGAAQNGIRVGVYFFSQALSVDEAEEEAEFLLNILASCAVTGFDLPVAFDWEPVETADSRTLNVGREVTDFALAFCGKLSDAGYEPAVYSYRYFAYFNYDLSRLADCPLWIGAPGTHPDFYYRHAIWQYSDSGTVSGISAPVDLDLLLTPIGEGSS